jgi:hypothetical protein
MILESGVILMSLCLRRISLELSALVELLCLQDYSLAKQRPAQSLEA